MPLLTEDPVTQLAFSVYENRGVYALLLGSGLSRAAEIPTGWEITLDLVRRIAAAKGVEGENDWAEWHRRTTGEEPNYSKLLEEVASSPDERRAVLNSYIEPDNDDREAGRKTPTDAHYAVADLARAGFVRVIVTTNFDKLIETALRERGVEPTIVGSADALRGAEPLTHTRCYVLKLHGDYKDARILNTDEELSAYPAEYDALLDRIIDEHGLIIAGWSGAWDHALRSAILRAPTRRYPTYWALRGALAPAAQELADQRRARIVSISDADSFFNGLRDRVQTLEQTHRQAPLTADLAVGSAKRFLAKPEYRIQLGDLVEEHAGRLLKSTAEGDLGPQGPWSVQEFQRRLGRYEAASEVLAKVTGVLGRWGDGSEMRLVLDVLRTQYGAAENTQGGIVVWLHLRAYPSVLLYSTYALGLVRAGRWGTLHSLYSAEVHQDHRGPKSVVELLHLDTWKGASKQLWNHLEGYDRRYTPFADYQAQLLGRWSAAFAPLTPDFDLLYERFELLGAFAYLDRYSKDQLQLSLSQGSHVGIPVGRVGWDSQRRDTLISWISSSKVQDELLAAGFCRQDPEFVAAAIQVFQHAAGRF